MFNQSFSPSTPQCVIALDATPPYNFLQMSPLITGMLSDVSESQSVDNFDNNDKVSYSQQPRSPTLPSIIVNSMQLLMVMIMLVPLMMMLMMLKHETYNINAETIVTMHVSKMN